MTLVKSKLQNPLRDLFEGTNGFPASGADAAEDLAAIYRAYAGDAAAAATQPVAAALTGAGNTLAAALAAAFAAAKEAGPSGVATLGLAMDTAFVAFWLTPPVAFVFPVTGTATIAGVVTVAAPGVLAPALTSLFVAGAAGGPTAAQQAQAMATILDSWTRTVLVVNTPITPPGPPAPPTPLA
jgi:hypothetical protein